MKPIIGSTWHYPSERLTLTEAIRREQSRAVWSRAARALHFLGLL